MVFPLLHEIPPPALWGYLALCRLYSWYTFKQPGLGGKIDTREKAFTGSNSILGPLYPSHQKCPLSTSETPSRHPPSALWLQPRAQHWRPSTGSHWHCLPLSNHKVLCGTLMTAHTGIVMLPWRFGDIRLSSEFISRKRVAHTLPNLVGTPSHRDR